jgi:hypothetical protein
MEQINIEMIIEDAGTEWVSEQRNVFLVRLPYSVQVATTSLEMDFAEKWLLEKCGEKGVNWERFFYGKIHYNFGYAEYFFQNELDSTSFINEIPKIFAVFPDGTKSRTNSQGDFFDLEL